MPQNWAISYEYLEKFNRIIRNPKGFSGHPQKKRPERNYEKRFQKLQIINMNLQSFMFIIILRYSKEWKGMFNFASIINILRV